jgi:hypothetical protein
VTDDADDADDVESADLERLRQLEDRAWAYYHSHDVPTSCDHSNRLAFSAGYRAAVAKCGPAIMNAARRAAIEECLDWAESILVEYAPDGFIEHASGAFPGRVSETVKALDRVAAELRALLEKGGG